MYHSIHARKHVLFNKKTELVVSWTLLFKQIIDSIWKIRKKIMEILVTLGRFDKKNSGLNMTGIPNLVGEHGTVHYNLDQTPCELVIRG